MNVESLSFNDKIDLLHAWETSSKKHSKMNLLLRSILTDIKCDHVTASNIAGKYFVKMLDKKIQAKEKRQKTTKSDDDSGVSDEEKPKNEAEVKNEPKNEDVSEKVEDVSESKAEDVSEKSNNPDDREWTIEWTLPKNIHYLMIATLIFIITVSVYAVYQFYGFDTLFINSLLLINGLMNKNRMLKYVVIIPSVLIVTSAFIMTFGYVSFGNFVALTAIFIDRIDLVIR